VQIVQVDNVVSTYLSDVLTQLLDVDGFGGSLHHDNYNVPENGDGREGDNDGEEVRAEGVHVPEAWEEIYRHGSYNDTHAHQHVTEDVDEGSVHIDVGFDMFVAMVMMMVMLGLMALFVL